MRYNTTHTRCLDLLLDLAAVAVDQNLGEDDTVQNGTRNVTSQNYIGTESGIRVRNREEGGSSRSFARGVRDAPIGSLTSWRVVKIRATDPAKFNKKVKSANFPVLLVFQLL